MDNIPLTVKDIMTKNVTSVHQEISLFDAHEIMVRSNFDGVPVVDAQGHVIGILTEYDMISKASVMHLPTLQKLITHFQSFIDQGGFAEFRKELKELQDLTVLSIMNRDPLMLPADTTFETVVETFFKHHRVNPIPIVDDKGVLVGIVSRYDILKIFEQLKSLTLKTQETS